MKDLPLVDGDRHAVSQAIYKGVEGAECESLYYKFVEMNKQCDVRFLQQGQDLVEDKRHQRGMRRVL